MCQTLNCGLSILPLILRAEKLNGVVIARARARETLISEACP